MNPNQTQDGSRDQRDFEIARALDQDEIQAYFQPKVDLRTARAVGVEALARWAHPDLRVISAEGFIDRVVSGGHLRALTERVMEFSTRAAGDWWRSGLGLQLSVNLPLGAVSASTWDFPRYVADVLDASGLPGEALQFEVTEDDLLIDGALAADLLGRLRKLGATVSIDDFGTGYFSLRQLTELPVDELKLDNSLIANLANDEDRSIVRSTIHLAHHMGLGVVAEGVETEEAWRQVRSMGVERAQGFLISKPLPSREVPAWLAAWNHRARELSSTKRVQRRSKAAAARRAKAPAEAAEATA